MSLSSGREGCVMRNRSAFSGERKSLFPLSAEFLKTVPARRHAEPSAEFLNEQRGTGITALPGDILHEEGVDCKQLLCILHSAADEELKRRALEMLLKQAVQRALACSESPCERFDGISPVRFEQVAVQEPAQRLLSGGGFLREGKLFQKTVGESGKQRMGLRSIFQNFPFYSLEIISERFRRRGREKGFSGKAGKRHDSGGNHIVGNSDELFPQAFLPADQNLIFDPRVHEADGAGRQRKSFVRSCKDSPASRDPLENPFRRTERDSSSPVEEGLSETVQREKAFGRRSRKMECFPEKRTAVPDFPERTCRRLFHWQNSFFVLAGYRYNKILLFSEFSNIIGKGNRSLTGNPCAAASRMPECSESGAGYG